MLHTEMPAVSRTSQIVLGKEIAQGEKVILHPNILQERAGTVALYSARVASGLITPLVIKPTEKYVAQFLDLIDPKAFDFIEAIDLALLTVKSEEPYFGKAVLNQHGKWILGWGESEHVASGQEIKEGDTTNLQAAHVALIRSVKTASIHVEVLTDGRFKRDIAAQAALFSLAHNIGSGSFMRSQLLRLILEGKPKREIEPEFHRLGGRRGEFTYRRQREAALFLLNP
jgi:GH24 family phage-related lysozyme (muramidase)